MEDIWVRNHVTRLITMRVIKEKTAGLIIDVQEKLFPHINKKEDLEKNLKILISGLQILGIPIIVTEQYRKGLGNTIPGLFQVSEELKTLEKICFSCYDDSQIKDEIDNLKAKFIIIAGIETHVCVLQTCLDLLDANYRPVVVKDCVSSRKIEDKELAIERLRNEGAIITSYESILFELTRISGSEQFKAISKLVK
jgi:nicotinamidase-related amidase